MARLASGCITVWEGGSLWVFDVPVPSADRPRTDTHGHHALQITYAVDGDFAIELAGGARLEGPAVVVAADAEHAFSARGLVALLFVEPESPAGRGIRGWLPPDAGASSLPAPLSEPLKARITHAFHKQPPDRAALQVVGRELADDLLRQAGGVARASPDARVQRMIGWAEAHLAAGITLTDAANVAALSPSRASHLFVEHTGLAFRTWLLWRRAMQAVECYADGDSLTAAAHAAGFSDSAHLSRTFRRLFGLPATVLELR